LNWHGGQLIMAISSDSRFGYRTLWFEFRFVFAAGRPAATFYFCHPQRRASAPLTAATGQPFQTHDCFFDLFAFLSKLA
jgi:hypothetical protein